jgi:hypothetical protein
MKFVIIIITLLLCFSPTIATPRNRSASPTDPHTTHKSDTSPAKQETTETRFLLTKSETEKKPTPKKHTEIKQTHKRKHTRNHKKPIGSSRESPQHVHFTTFSPQYEALKCMKRCFREDTTKRTASYTTNFDCYTKCDVVLVDIQVMCKNHPEMCSGEELMRQNMKKFHLNFPLGERRRHEHESRRKNRGRRHKRTRRHSEGTKRRNKRERE